MASACINHICNNDDDFLRDFNEIVDKILQENETKKKPLEGNALLDFTMDEIYFRKNGIFEIYKPLYLQFQDETRNLDS